jgi:GntR family transcriptional repressor for pyruvate dehydrogenase complex
MMGFDRIEAVSLTDQFVQKIEAMIISGELVPGDQLPPAREMSARMGVSRPVISAGLVELEKMGFVEIVTRQGVYVSDYRKSGAFEL